MTALAIILVKDEYARLLIGNANYGMQALIEESALRRTEDDDAGEDVYIGSSMFRQGLDINSLPDAGDSYILSYNGNQPFLEYNIVKYLVEHDVRIKQIYIDMYAYSLETEPWVHDEKIFLETNLAFKTKIWKEMSQNKDAGFADQWQMFVTSNNDLLLTWPVSYSIVNRMFYRGGNVSRTDTVNAQFASETACANQGISYDDHMILKKTDFDKKQIDYLEQLIHFCKDNKIQLTFIETPKYISVDHDDKYPGMMQEFVQILENKGIDYWLSSETEEVLKKSTDLSFKHMNGAVEFDSANTDNFIDYIHLSQTGRTVYTKNLAKAIKKDGTDK